MKLRHETISYARKFMYQHAYNDVGIIGGACLGVDMASNSVIVVTGNKEKGNLTDSSAIDVDNVDKAAPASRPQQTEQRSHLFKRLRNKSSKDEKTSRKPPENKWLQQQMPACRPVFTAVHTCVLFVGIGLLFIGLGIGFLVTSIRLKEVSIDYGNAVCGVQNADALVTWLGSNDTFSSAYLRSRNITECNNISYDSCESYLKCVAQLPNVFRADAPICKCIVNITVPSTMNEVYLYYGLNNFFQNHRRYLNSWNPNQLQGSLKTTDGCSPLDSRRPVNKTDGSLEAASLPIAPCGLIANSFFNDSFVFNSNGVNIDETNIAWKTDRDTRFKNPTGNNITAADVNGTTMPPSWPRDLSNLPNGLQNEHLIVWFRVSAFWRFRKLYGRLSVNGSPVLPNGTYPLLVDYNFPVGGYRGAKFLVLSEVSWLGGKNNFLGIAYIVTGALAIAAGIVLLIVHLACSKWKPTNKGFGNRPF